MKSSFFRFATAIVAGVWLALLAPAVATASASTAQINNPEDPPECGPSIAESIGSAEAERAVIGEVILDRRQIFDTSLPEEDRPLYRLANRYHVLTRPATIRRQLLFDTGDPYLHRLLLESERILRQKRYFFDASVRPVRYADGIVDVCVSTRDVWTLSPGLSYSRSGGEDEYDIELQELNIAGTGAAIGVARRSRVDRDSTRVNFSDPQIGSSRFAIGVELADNSDGDGQQLVIERPFFALDARWSTGLRLINDDRIDSFYDLGDEISEYRHDEQFAQVHYGWSGGLSDGWVRRWSVGAVLDEDRFSTPAATALPGPLPADRKLVYPFVAFEILQDRFARIRNHDQIGRTEDLYVGTRFASRIGWVDRDFGADREALILSLDASKGFSRNPASLLLLRSQLTGRLEDGDLRNGIWHASARYYHNWSENSLLFMSASADFGDELDLDNTLELGGDSGLRGYPLRYQAGDSRALIRIEQRYFTDWYPLRLARVGAALFADIGRTWGTNPAGGRSAGWLKDIGFGLRLAPTRGGSGKTVHIDLAFPLDGDPSIDNLQLVLEGRRGF